MLLTVWNDLSSVWSVVGQYVVMGDGVLLGPFVWPFPFRNDLTRTLLTFYHIVWNCVELVWYGGMVPYSCWSFLGNLSKFSARKLLQRQDAGYDMR
jgi:hypothetical protein